MNATHRCTAADGCDESTVRPYVVTHHDGTTSRADYCSDCLYLARIDWNGDTALVEPARVAFRHPQTGEVRTGALTGQEWPEHNAIGVRLADGREVAVSRDNLVEVTHA